MSKYWEQRRETKSENRREGGSKGESEEAEIRGSWMKKKSSFRENVLWSVKLQPMVLHIVPEALPKKKKKSSNVTRKPARQGERRGGWREPVRRGRRGASERSPTARDLDA